MKKNCVKVSPTISKKKQLNDNNDNARQHMCTIMQMKRLTLIIINQTYYENSDWSRVSSQYTIECEVDMIIQYLQRLIIMGVLFKRLFKICIIKKLLNSVFV